MVIDHEVAKNTGPLTVCYEVEDADAVDGSGEGALRAVRVFDGQLLALPLFFVLKVIGGFPDRNSPTLPTATISPWRYHRRAVRSRRSPRRGSRVRRTRRTR